MAERAQEIGFSLLPLSAARGCRHLDVRMERNWDRAYNGFPTFLLFSSLWAGKHWGENREGEKRTNATVESGRDVKEEVFLPQNNWI